MANYYDLDDIIAEEERVSVVFRKAVNGVGIDASAETDCVEIDSKVELPFWLAHELYLRKVVKLKVPTCFNQKTRLELGADAACVDLRSRCPYFYEFGCKIARLFNSCEPETRVEGRDLGSFLLSAFENRYKEVLAKAHSAAFAAASKCFTLLTKEETTMYEAAQSSMAAFKKWRMGGPRFQKASILGRKRKPTD
ncbi:DNA replication complex GINS protein psf3 [Ziziphus jujuba]|uniref:DNA replication complex GINS protein psf3 n=1 Tax=Ziziphus jujuba TaxID=326968 RepID=A0A6P3ZGW0_ZIZJJ|nr:DNA replication complex GINS protein psf3 [Ziziphus jujuba]